MRSSASVSLMRPASTCRTTSAAYSPKSSHSCTCRRAARCSSCRRVRCSAARSGGSASWQSAGGGPRQGAVGATRGCAYNAVPCLEKVCLCHRKCRRQQLRLRRHHRLAQAALQPAREGAAAARRLLLWAQHGMDGWSRCCCGTSDTPSRPKQAAPSQQDRRVAWQRLLLLCYNHPTGSSFCAAAIPAPLRAAAPSLVCWAAWGLSIRKQAAWGKQPGGLHATLTLSPGQSCQSVGPRGAARRGPVRWS